jgi:hypothetical protein
MSAQQHAARVTLSVSALAMASLIALQAFSPPAHAGMVSKTGGYTALTAVGGRTDNHEILLLIDDRNEQLFVYSAEQNQPIALLANESLPSLFTNARAQAVGQRP